MNLYQNYNVYDVNSLLVMVLVSQKKNFPAAYMALG